MFGKLASSSFKLGQSQYCVLRDFLLAHLCLQNGSRTGAIPFMRTIEVERATRQGSNSMTVTVLDHKTVESAGPAPLTLECQVYSYLGIFSKKVRPQITGPIESSGFVFVTYEGLHMKSSSVTEQFNSLWNRTVGPTETRKRMNAGLIRKTVTTRVHSEYPHMKGDVAITLNHSVATAEKYYYVQNKIKTAGQTSEKLWQIIREGSATEDNKSFDDIARMAMKEDNLSKETVKNLLMKYKLLGKYDVNTVVERAKELKEQEMTTIINLDGKEQDVLNQTGLPQPNTVETDGTNSEDNDEPFTDAGSSVCRSRISYTKEEVSTICRVFKDLIQGSRNITTAEVMDTFNNTEELRCMLSKLLPSQLVNKVRTERKGYQRRKNNSKKKRKR